MKKVLVSVVWILFLLPSLTAQEVPELWQPTKPLMGYTPTPQTWSFMKYGNTPVDYYTGTPRVEIPVYTYKDNDFTLPISLGYASNGLTPAKQTGVVGLNWFLNAGAVITREINGVPDESFSQGPSSLPRIVGFMGNGGYTYSDNQLLQFNVANNVETLNAFTLTSNRIETEADVYHFSFFGHSGSFHMDGQRNIKIYGTNGGNYTYKIRFLSDTSFSITTEDGYEYTFGGDERALERVVYGTFSTTTINWMVTERPHPVVTWNITQIKAPNGRKVIFSYRGSELPLVLDYFDNTRDDLTVQFVQTKHTITNTGFLTSGASAGSSAKQRVETVPDETIYKRANVTKTTYLSGIEIQGALNATVCRIDFSYSRKDSVEIGANSVYNSMYSTDYARYKRMGTRLLKLDQIKVAAVGEAARDVRVCKLNYHTKDLRIVLDSVRVSGEGTYRMQYYDDGKHPDMLSNAIDFWGYYNGVDTLSDAYISPTKITPSNEEMLVAYYKNPDARYSMLGCLKTIQYPTGGHTQFEYESNEASLMVSKPSYRGYTATCEAYNFLGLNNQSCGGVRVAKITDYDGLANRATRTFKYQHADLAKSSSGIVLNFPRTNFGVWHTFGSYGMEVSVPSLMHSPNNTFDRGHIGYSVVNETYADGSSIRHEFNNYETHPDEYTGQQSQLIPNSGSNDGISPLYLNNNFRHPNSRSYQRGRISRRTYLNAGGNAVKREEYTYGESNADSTVNYSTYVIPSGQFWWSVKRYTGDYRLVSKKTTMIFNNREIAQTDYVFYNSLGQVRSIASYDNMNVCRRQYVLYWHEYNAGCKILSYPLYVAGSIQRSGSEQITSANRYRYLTFNNQLKPSQIATAEILAPVSLTTNIKSTLDALSYHTELTFDSYDTSGNATQTTNALGIPTGYLWDASGRYPVAIVNNAQYTQISNLGPDALYALPNALLNYYQYKPLAGLIQHSDMSRRSLYYNYDTYDRLNLMRDETGTLKTITYNF